MWRGAERLWKRKHSRCELGLLPPSTVFVSIHIHIFTRPPLLSRYLDSNLSYFCSCLYIALVPMGIIRPATPGFLVTLVATILLAVVSFSVPWVKSVYFLKASLQVESVNGSITFGTLGYCTTLSNGTTCSSPSVGYEYGSFCQHAHQPVKPYPTPLRHQRTRRRRYLHPNPPGRSQMGHLRPRASYRGTRPRSRIVRLWPSRPRP